MKISAIICTSNRPAGLAKLLPALLTQDRLPDQIIIVEDRQGPEPRQSIDALKAKGIDVSYLRRSPPHLTASRNLALGYAHGELISFFDDDTVPAPDYLQVVERVFAADLSAQLGGLAALLEPWDHRPGPGDRLWQSLMYLAGLWSLPYRRRREIFSPSVRSRFALFLASFLPGVVTYRRKALQGLHFDENLQGYGLGEDLDISFSLSSRWQLYRCALLRIRHQHAPQHRPQHFARAKMLVRNLAYITCKHSACRMGTLLILAWQLIGLCFAHLLFAFLGDSRRHLSTLAGLFAGTRATAHDLQRRFLAPGHHRFLPSSPARDKFVAAASALPRPGHVLFVLNSLALGGAERLTLALLQNLDPARFRGSLLCLQNPGPLVEKLPGWIKLYHNFSSGKFDPLVLPAIVRLIISRQVDLLVSVGNGGDRMFWSSLASLLTGRRLVVWCHAQPIPRTPTFERTNRLLQRVPHTFIAVSASQAQALAEILHIPPSRIKLIENALPDVSEILAKKPSAQQRTRFRRQLKLPAKAVLIATVANLRSVKGHDVLIDAAAEVLSRDRNVYFLLIGDGPQRQAIREHIHERRLDEKQIVFLGQRFDVADILRHCDLFVSSSYTESFGLAVLEALAAGLPVISTDSAGPRCLIDHNRTGLLTPVGQPDRLARAILDLLNAPQRRTRLARQAQQFAQQKRFHISTMVRAFEGLFELLI